jgi:23S rRNA pseudouridine2605 synthase
VKHTGLARALSKLGLCSRSEGAALIKRGKVSVNHIVRKNPEFPVVLGQDIIAMDHASVNAATPVYLMLNKPRGLVTTANDEHGRDTVFACFEGAKLPHLSPVGRLDQASEGLILFTNDTTWADAVTSPDSHLDKVYHVQIDAVIDAALLTRLQRGIPDHRAKSVTLLRSGEKTTWLEITLDEGKNRHIRRLLAAFELEVLRLVRVAIGPLQLGELTKGQWRMLTPAEVASLHH